MYAAKRALKPVAQFGAAAAYRQVSARPPPRSPPPGRHHSPCAARQPHPPSGRRGRQPVGASEASDAIVSCFRPGGCACVFLHPRRLRRPLAPRTTRRARVALEAARRVDRRFLLTPSAVVSRRVGTSVGGGPDPISRRRPSSLLFDSLRGFFSFIALVRSRDGGMGGGDETPDVLCFARARDAHDTHRASRRHPNAGR